MANEPLKVQIEQMNREIRDYEKERSDAVLGVVDILESLDPDGVKEIVGQLRDSVKGMTEAKDKYELDLYQKNFHALLKSIAIDEDVLGVFKCIDAFRNLNDLTQVRINFDLRRDAQSRIENTSVYLKYISDNLNEFYLNLEEMEDAILKKLSIIADEDEKNKALLNAGLERIAILRNEFHKARDLAQRMVQADTVEKYSALRSECADQLNHIREICGGEAGSKELSNKIAKVCEAQVDELADMRAFYLADPPNYLPLVVDFTWIGIGTGMIIVGFIFTTGITALALGLASIIYGLVDLVRFLIGPAIKLGMPGLGKIPVEERDLSSRENMLKIAKKIGLIAIGAISLAAVIAAIAFPPIAIPMAAIGVVTAVITTAFYAVKLYKSYRAKQMVDAKFESLHTKFDRTQNAAIHSELAKGKQTTAHLVVPNAVDAKMFLFLQNQQKPKVDEPIVSEALPPDIIEASNKHLLK